MGERVNRKREILPKFQSFNKCQGSALPLFVPHIAANDAHTPLRLMILQLRQIGLTDARTFMPYLPNGLRSGRGFRDTFQIGLLHQAFVLMRHHVRLRTWAMKSMTTTTTISSEVPPK